MNKTDLVEHMATQADISKAAASRALQAAIVAIRTTLKHGNSVSLVGLGSFSVTERPARQGHNPRTKTAIHIQASRAAKFRPSKALKDTLNASPHRPCAKP